MSIASHPLRRGASRFAAAALLACAGLASAATPGVVFEPVNDRPNSAIDTSSIYLRSGTAKTTKLSKQQIAQAVASRDASKRHVVQLDGVLTPQQRRSLSDAGVTLYDYLPANAFIVDLSNADADQLSALEFVRWVGDVAPSWKLDAELGTREFTTPERKQIKSEGRSLLTITLFAGVDTDQAKQSIAALPNTLVHHADEIGGNEVVVVELPTVQISDLATIASVQFVEEQPEITFRNSTDRWIVQSNINNNFPVYDAGIHGEGQIIGVLDGAVNNNHCSFSNGKIIHYNAAGSSSHGTHVAATAAGDNGVNDNTRGVAYLANLVTNTVPSFNETAVNQRLNLHHSQGARVHTNSWGNDGTTAYDSLARGFDVFLHNNEESFVCLAVTNGSSLRNPENAKNLLAVGASQDNPSQASHCSGGVGPTSDGRRKPELYAPGCGTTSANSSTSCGTTSFTGTSMASPAIAGAAAMVRQYYTDGYHPNGNPVGFFSFTPSGALIKATLLNSAADMTGISGYPSNLEGWGRVLLDNALFFTGDSRTMFVEDTRNADGLSTNDEIVIPVNVLGSGEQVRFTLVWTEPAASSGASFAHVNNLDLEVTSPSGPVYKGNVFSGGQSTTGGSHDDRNNVEQVHVSSPPTGAWVVKIKGTAINSGTQGFALVVTGDVDSQGGPIPLLMSVASTPSLIPPATSESFDVTIKPGDDSILPASANLLYRYDAGAYQQVALTFISGEKWQATLPTVACADTPEFYVSVEGADTGIVTKPSDAPLTTYTSAVGVVITTAELDFETDPSWVLSGSPSAGAWVRAVPGNFGEADPPTDSDGSGQCYVTGNTASEELNGISILTSPPYDASGPGTLSYDYWVKVWGVGNGSTSGGDALTLEYATNAAGTNWALARTHNTVQSVWNTSIIQIGPGGTIPSTPTLRLRFTGSESQFPTPFEAGIDNLILAAGVDCTDPGGCDGDANADNIVDVNDISYVLFRLGNSGTPGTVDGDANADGIVDVNDISYVLFRLGPC
jgi:hypothetical protein